MFTVPKFAGRSLAHLGSLLNHRWLIAVVTLVLVLLIRRPVAAQTAEAAGIVVTGEAIATPTPHDNFREMRQHLLAEVAGTEITVTKKATVIKLDQQPPVENNNDQELFIKAPGFLITEQHTPGQFNFNSVDCVQPFGRVLSQQICAFDWWHLRSHRREIL
jgi:hypothetical protein